MPPTLALILTLGVIVFLFRRDFRQKPNVTWAEWLPIIWLFLSCSRPTSVWLGMFGITGGLRGIDVSTVMEEGSPLDALVYCGLIVTGLYILKKRRVNLFEIVRANPWLAAFFLYCFLAIFWSDFPLVSFKRWIKIVGHPVMVLVLFTEPNPGEALTCLMKRCAYVLLPVSILFIKYYPRWGRTFDQISGIGNNTGITTNKNTLGCFCLILGLFLFWHFLHIRKVEKSSSRRQELWSTLFLLMMVGYLLRKAHSATAAFSLVFGALIILLLGLRRVNKRSIGLYAVVGVVLLSIGQVMFDIFGMLVAFSGHVSTIEGRAELWHELLAFDTSPIFGTGFESFWLGQRLQALWALHWWHPTEAHNGYLETYLNLGAIGVALMLAFLISVFVSAKRELLAEFEWGRFRMAVLGAVVVYNWTEAAFKGLSPLWFLFYIIAVDYRKSAFVSIQEPEERPQLESDGEMMVTRTNKFTGHVVG